MGNRWQDQVAAIHVEYYYLLNYSSKMLQVLN